MIVEVDSIIQLTISGGIKLEKLIQNIYSLTPLQEGILYELKMENSKKNLYISQMQIKVTGELEANTLLRAWNEVVNRHEALRMKVISENVENSVQVVFNTIDYQPAIIDITNFNEKDQLKEIERISFESRQMEVNNSKLMKFQIVKLKESEFIIIWTHHHIILDGWSTSIVIKEFFDIYNKMISKNSKGTISRSKQYGDFIRFINKMKKEDLNDFWENKVKHIDQPTITFPVNTQIEEKQRENNIFWEIDKKQSKILRDFAAENHVTVNVLLQLIWSIVLKKISHQDQIIFGIVSSGRSSDLPKVEEIVGLLINTLPMIIEVKNTDSIVKVLKQSQKTLNDILYFSQVSLADIKRYTKLKKENPLFESLFVYENYPEAKSENSAIQWEIKDGTELHSFPLSLQAQDNKETIKCKLFFNPSCLENTFSEKIKEAFMQITKQITKAQHINEISIKVDFPMVKNIINTKDEESFDASKSKVNIDENLRRLWEEFFKGSEIHQDSDFFQLGGHSIMAMKFISKINKSLNTNLKLKDLFENPTLHLLNLKIYPEKVHEYELGQNVISTVEYAFKEILSISSVNKNADFFELGGHSLLAMKLLTKLNKQLNHSLTLKDIFQHSTVLSLSKYIIDQIPHTSESDIEEIKSESYTLSSNQEALWFDQKLNGNTTNYNIPQKYILTGKVDISLLEKALNQVINRHEILRTVVYEKDGKGYQEIQENLHCKIKEIDLSKVNTEDQINQISQIEEEVKLKIFEIEKGPLLSITLVKLKEENFILFVNHHHFVFDGWSVGIFFDEWLSFYDKVMNQEEISANKNFLQYKDFSLKQKEWLKRNFEQEMLFWKRHLRGNLPKLELPLDAVRKKKSQNKGNSFIVELDKKELQALKLLSLEKNSTLFMTLLTMYQSFLGRYTGQNDVIVGSSLANRILQDTERSIGYFVNTLPFRLEVEPKETFGDILRRNTKHIIDVYDHQQMPLEKIVEGINPDRTLANNSLFQTVFILQNNAKAKFQSEYVKLQPEVITSNGAKFDLSLAAEEYEDKLLCAFEYNSEIFNENTIRLLSENFLSWVKSIIIQPDLSLNQISVISKSQENVLMDYGQGETISFEGIDASIPEEFYKIVKKSSAKIAIVDGIKRITYQELNEMSNQIAWYLLKKGVSKEEKIGIYANRSIDMVAGMLGIIKAGAAYVPLDPQYPEERLNYIIQDASISYCLTHENLKEKGLINSSKAICFEDIEREAPMLRSENLYIASRKNLAYVIYTSGTTGRPKGVMIEHRGVINLVFNQNEMMCLNSSAKVLQFATFNFDSSVIEIFSSLLFGAELHISIDKKNQFDINKLVEQIKKEKISHIILPPAILKEIPIMELPSIKVLGSAGSECPVDLVSKFKHISFFNGYGPTEYSVCTSYKIFPPNEDKTSEFVVPIGKPLSNTTVFILDKNRKLVPLGSVGELYIGGIGLARGYLNNEKLTNKRFICNPFNPSERLYRTGDLVKFNRDGELIYIGRTDDQVKLRGYRVELSEVNISLQQIEGIKDSFTTVVQDKFGNKRLMAYYMVDNNISEKVIRKQLRETLPNFMIPSYFMKLDIFPLTPNGKIDKKALPKWDEKVKIQSHSLDAEKLSEIEMKILSIWRDVLNNPLIGSKDNFFDCGGDSIISIQICSAAKEKQLFFTPKDIFEYQTVHELANIVQEQAQNTVVQEKIVGCVPLTPIQSWFFNEEHKNIHHWNQSIVLMKKNEMSTEKYKKVIEKLVDHHDVLRTYFEKQDGLYIGNIRDYNNTFDCIEYHMSDLKEGNNLKRIKELEDVAQQSLNIHNGPMMKVLLFRDKKEVRVFWVIHHLLVDGVSWRILLEDFERCYQQTKNNEELFLPLKTTSYKKWSEELNRYGNMKPSETVVQYWEKEINKPVSPTAINLGENCDFEDIFKIEVDVPQTQNLIKNTLRKYKTTIDELLLSVIARVFASKLNINDFWIDLEGHGRENITDHIDLTRTVGWFTSMYPIRIEGKASLGSTLKSTKHILRNVPNKGFDFGVLKYISNQNYSYPTSIISYNYLGQFNNLEDVVHTESSNIDLSYKFSSKINFVVSIVNNKLIVNIIGDTNNTNFQLFCKEFKSKLNLILNGQLNLNDAVVAADFDSEKVVDESTINYFINRFKNIEDIYPVTSLQEGMLFHSEIAQSSEYISQLSFDLKGDLNLDKLERAWNDTCRKYEILRSVFRRNHIGDRYQLILNDIDYVFNHMDLQNIKGKELKERVDNLLLQSRERQIDLENGPLMTVTLVKLSDSHYKFVWTHHHALIDGWSLQIVIGHFIDSYHNSSLTLLDTGEHHRRAYKQFIKNVQNINKNEEAAFWKSELKSINEVNAIANKVTVDKATALNQVIEYSLSETLTEKLITVAQNNRVTINTIVQGVWGIVLSYINNSNAICYGITSSGRNSSISHIESAVGLLINTLPFSMKVDFEYNLSSYFADIQNKQLKMRDYESSSLTDIKQYAQIPWDKELFQQIFVFENYPSTEFKRNSDITIENSAGDESTNFNLTFSAAIVNSKLRYKTIYKDNIFDEDNVLRVMNSMETLFFKLTKDGNVTINDLLNDLKVEAL